MLPFASCFCSCWTDMFSKLTESVKSAKAVCMRQPTGCAAQTSFLWLSDVRHLSTILTAVAPPNISFYICKRSSPHVRAPKAVKQKSTTRTSLMTTSSQSRRRSVPSAPCQPWMYPRKHQRRRQERREGPAKEDSGPEVREHDHDSKHLKIASALSKPLSASASFRDQVHQCHIQVACSIYVAFQDASLLLVVLHRYQFG